MLIPDQKMKKHVQKLLVAEEAEGTRGSPRKAKNALVN